MNYYLKVLKNYGVFNGRAQRKEYWMFVLINGIIIITLNIIANTISGYFNAILLIYNILLLFPSLAVSVRRLHDVNKSGWWFLIIFIPFIGLYYFFLLIKDSYPGENKYGLNPKEAKKTI